MAFGLCSTDSAYLGMHRRHDRGRATPTRRPVYITFPGSLDLPVEVPCAHDDGVAAVGAVPLDPLSTRWATNADDVAAGVIDLRVLHRVLLPARYFDHLAEPVQLRSVLACHLQGKESG